MQEYYVHSYVRSKFLGGQNFVCPIEDPQGLTELIRLYLYVTVSESVDRS